MKVMTGEVAAKLITFVQMQIQLEVGLGAKLLRSDRASLLILSASGGTEEALSWV